MMNLKTIAFLLFTFSFFTVKSQSDFLPGQVVTGAGDTVKGLIGFQAGSHSIEFKKNTSSAGKVYRSEDVKSFSFKSGHLYLSKVLKTVKENPRLFMEALVLGKASLFSYHDGENIHYILEKGNGDLFDFSKVGHQSFNTGEIFKYDENKFTAVLRYAFADDQDLFPLINQAALNENTLIEIVIKYNKHGNSNEPARVLKKPVPRFRIKVAPMAIYNTTSLKFNNTYNLQTISAEPYYSFGLVLNSEFPRGRKNFSVQLSGQYDQNNFSDTGISPVNSSPEDIAISFSTLKGKVGIKYTYPKGKIRPSLMAGVNFVSIQNVKGKITDHPESTKLYVQEFRDFMIVDQSVLMGYSLDFELGYYAGKLRPFLQAGYDYSSGRRVIDPVNSVFASAVYPNYLSNFHVTAGIYF